MITRLEAIDILRLCGVRIGADFHALRTSQVDELATAATLFKYRKPKNANGSRARYFHAYLQRRAARGDV